jgi:hypothetical protein
MDILKIGGEMKAASRLIYHAAKPALRANGSPKVLQWTQANRTWQAAQTTPARRPWVASPTRPDYHARLAVCVCGRSRISRIHSDRFSSGCSSAW